MVSETKLSIEGMTCMHCKMNVEKALMAVPGVTKALVKLPEKEAVVEGTAAQADLAKAVETAGYKVVG